MAAAKELEIEGLMDMEQVDTKGEVTDALEYSTSEISEGLMNMEQTGTNEEEIAKPEYSEPGISDQWDQAELNNLKVNGVQSLYWDVPKDSHIKRLYCELCEKTFTQHGNLSRHMKTLHDGMKHSYELCCDKCDKTFTQHGSLSRHKITVHEGLRYSCKHCQ